MITVFGIPNHTLAELEDLLNAKGYQIGQLHAATGSHLQDIQSKDPSWISDWQAMNARYDAAHARAVAMFNVMKMNPTPNNSVPAEGQYQAVLQALKQNPSTITKGDFQDLNDRAHRLGYTADYSGTPQPRSSSDIEGLLYKLAGGLLKPVEDAYHSITNLAKAPYKEPKKYPKFWLFALLGGVAGYFGLKAAYKGTKEIGVPVAKAYFAPELELAHQLTSKEGLQQAVAAGLGIKLPSEEKKP